MSICWQDKPILKPWQRNLIRKLTRINGWKPYRLGLSWGIQTGGILNQIALACNEAELNEIEREAAELLPRRRDAR